MIPVHIQGRNPDADAALEDIRVNGGSMTYLSAAATLYIISTDAGDTTQTVRIEGVDGNGRPVIGEATLNGQTQVEVKTVHDTPATMTFLRVNKAWNNDAAVYAGVVYVATADTDTAGVPDTATKIQAQIAIGKEHSEDAIYYVPAGQILKHLKLQASILQPATATTHVDIFVFVREAGQQFQVKHSMALYLEGRNTAEYEFPKNFSVPAGADVVVRCNSDTANAIVACTLDGELDFYGQ